MEKRINSKHKVPGAGLEPARGIALAVSTIAMLALFLTSCTVTKKVKDGDTAFQLKQYAVAIEMLEEEYHKTNDREVKLRKALYLAKSYDLLLDYDKAVQWYETVLDYNRSGSYQTQLAYAYKKNEQYEKAYPLFEKAFVETYDKIWNQEAKLCKDAVQQKKNITDYNLVNFVANTKYGEYSPSYLDDDHLVFTSDREESIGGKTYNWTGNSFSDLYVVNISGRKVNNFDAILNTGANEGTACFSKDQNEIYFTRCESIDLRDQHCRIYFSHRPNGFWMEPEPLMFFGEKTNFAHPCLIENDSVLIFSAAPAGSDGTYDLYYSERIEGGWTEPDLMPSAINSLGNEKFPTSYGDTLYFSSDKLPGYGGYDIFSSYLRANGSWSSPQNMGIPINSGADDFGLAIDPTARYDGEILLQGYLSSSRNEGAGDDIFFFTKYKSKEVEDEEPKKDIAEKTGKMYLSAKVVELKYEDGDPNKKIISREAIAGAQLEISGMRENKSVVTDQSGRHIMEVLPNTNLVFLSSKKDFIVKEMAVSTYLTKPLTSDTTINVEIAMDRILYDKEIVLQNIYYDYERWEIRKDARPSLDSLKQLLELNSALKIQLSSHTDCRGEVEYNQNLSQRRAESAVQYLQENGIAPERLVAKGYGEANPSVKCRCDDCTSAQHQQNRRTTFKIVK